MDAALCVVDIEQEPTLSTLMGAIVGQKGIEKGHGRIAVGFGGNPADPSAIRGGPAFEVMFNIVHLLKRLGLRKQFELSFFTPKPSPSARMGDKAAAAVRKQLEAAGVKADLLPITERGTGVFRSGGAALKPLRVATH